MALTHTARQFGAPARIVEAVAAVNHERKLKMAGKVIAACGGNVTGKTIAILGLAFKQNTDDMREAPAIDIIKLLQGAGAKIQAYDPQAIEQARSLVNDVAFCQNAYTCAEGASALVIVTEWDAFRALDLDRIKNALFQPIVVDLRNIYPPDEMRKRGFQYSSIGRR